MARSPPTSTSPTSFTFGRSGSNSDKKRERDLGTLFVEAAESDGERDRKRMRSAQPCGSNTTRYKRSQGPPATVIAGTSRAAPIDLASDDDDDPWINVQFQDESFQEVRKSKLLGHVKERGKKIFEQAVKRCYNNKLELRLEDYPNTLTQRETTKGVLLQRYKEVWRPDLINTQKELTRQVKDCEDMVNKLKWDDDKFSFTECIAQNWEKRLQKSKHDLEVFDHLIKLLGDN
ncbi:hypothetical protein CERZMDRAFT_80884 [Cercospora zeae-maydis SCOH1-5]|uniref:Uncharacterized protein n=1 Tax=Cercospora zeae-maydis SCOH1-5 TaxID=717836 RepID=A0A6A6FTP6_9PEZI|nr:hypothetical protein CERZMDRAFT_80884 [Cercospora zeae-maydis SCOH1-5]